MPHLVGHLGHVVLRHHRRRLRIAQRLPRHLVGRADVGLHQRRSHGEGVGHVVERPGAGIGRQERRDVDVDAQQVAHGGAVLATVQSMQLGRLVVRMRRHHLVEPRAERRAELRERRGVWTARAGRRHQPRAHLPDHVFGALGVMVGPRHVEFGPREAAALQAIVVTTDAVLLHERALGVHRGGAGWGLWRRHCGAGPGHERNGHDREATDNTREPHAPTSPADGRVTRGPAETEN